ncbi:hypothetical protein RhiirA1_540145 [Rhizophagus irregularis]|uniref:Uncharacterized protein n=2 Tax=Rhizophagus irregularis TaxID=588596 RepID=A0A2N0R9J7_9GLOM|nr:hypothetical protein RhiirA1_540145 [Rhizophagus irregularis]
MLVVAQEISGYHLNRSSGITFIDKDLIETNINKGKSPANTSNTFDIQQNNNNITVIANLFEQLAQLPNKLHKAFILQDSFQKNLSNNEIINIIKLAFINDSNAFKFNVNNLSIKAPNRKTGGSVRFNPIFIKMQKIE